MDARRVRERVRADDGLVGLHAHARDGRHETAGLHELARVDVGMGVQLVPVHLDGHDHFLHGRVACALAQAVDGAFDLRRAVLHAGHGERRRHAQVVVAMHGHGHVLDAAHALHQVLDAAAELLGQRIARGVGDVHHGGARVHGGLDDAHEEVVVRPSRVLRVELHVFDELLRVLHALDGALHAFVLGDAQLVAQVAGTHAQARVDARALRVPERLGGAVDVLLYRAREAADDRLVAGELGDAAHALEVARTGNGETGLDDVHVETQQLTRDDQLLLGVHGSARRLLAVAQRGVEDVDFAGHVRHVLSNPCLHALREKRGRAGDRQTNSTMIANPSIRARRKSPIVARKARDVRRHAPCVRTFAIRYSKQRRSTLLE